MSQRRILVTSALPYANGHIHLGHLVEYIQTDIWVRFQRMRGHRVVYVCADDTHGTAIMIRAAQEGRSPEQLIASMKEAHQRDFQGFQIQFDHYGSTHSPANRSFAEQIWQAHVQAGMVFSKDVEQLYDPEHQVALADRFVRGTCPECGALDQPGDNCSECGNTYAPTDLLNPYSTLSGARPVLRSFPHLFVDLEKNRQFLQEWTQADGHLQPEVQKQINGSFLAKKQQGSDTLEPLRPWDVSRPAPYFGFEIPGHQDQYFYVWFDAPIGYLASSLEWAQESGENFDDWWRSPETEVHHFIGKDITYFHTLFWPSMLKTAAFNLPTRVQIHGFLTVNGEKMSKSKGTFVLAQTYLRHLDPAYLRYFYASQLGPGVEDIDLNLAEFTHRVNSHLVGKVVNLASRSARFIQNAGLSASYPDDGGLFSAAAAQGESIAKAYESCDYARAMREIMMLADRANEFVDRKEPWALQKKPGTTAEVQDICTVALNLYRQLIIYLAPVLPELARKSGELFGSPLTSWQQAAQPLVGGSVAEFRHLMQRADPKRVEALVESSAPPELREGAPTETRETTPTVEDDPAPLEQEPLAAECSIEDFAKIDLRVARVLEAEDVKGAKKLLKLKVGLGGAHHRTLFAGIKAAYQPAELVGRLVVVVANLAPRKMKFGTSEGMVTAAGPGEAEVYLLAPDTGAKPGQRVH